MPLDLPFPFTLPRLFRNPAISNFFPFPLGLRNSGVRLYIFLETIRHYDTVLLRNNIYALLTQREVKQPGYWPSSFLRFYGTRRSRGQ